MTGTPDPGRLARYLRQRRDFGESDLFLERLDRQALLAMVRSHARDAVGTTAVASARRSPASHAGAEAAARSPEADALGDDGDPRGHSDEQIGGLGYDALRDAALACTRCGLAKGRTQVVFSDGNPEGRLMVVGEAPGANEDATGLPFVGQAGKLLDLLLAAVDLSRKDSVYICNVLKCRPPGNRNPEPDEIELCAPYLKRQIALVKPEAILAVGTFAAQLLTGQNGALGKLRGDIYSYEGVPLVVTYHPAALLRNAGWTRATWDDLQLLRDVIDPS